MIDILFILGPIFIKIGVGMFSKEDLDKRGKVIYI